MADTGYLRLTANGALIKGASIEVKHPQWLVVSGFGLSMNPAHSHPETGSEGQPYKASAWFKVAWTASFPQLYQALIEDHACEGQFDLVTKGLVTWKMNFANARLTGVELDRSASGSSDSKWAIVEIASTDWEYKLSAEVAASMGSGKPGK